MGNWIPGDPTLVAQILKISAAYTPPPPESFVSPAAWGSEASVRERFGAAGVQDADISCTPETYRFRRPGPPSELLALFRDYYGPTMNAFEAASREGRSDALETELAALFQAQNQGGPESTDVPATYLRVVVKRQMSS